MTIFEKWVTETVANIVRDMRAETEPTETASAFDEVRRERNHNWDDLERRAAILLVQARALECRHLAAELQINGRGNSAAREIVDQPRQKREKRLGQRIGRQEGTMTPPCSHLNFSVHADVHRIQKDEASPDTVVAYHADIRIQCHECGQPFEFFGPLGVGLSHYQPTTSLDAQELRVPLVLPGTRPPDGLAGFSVSFPPGDPGKEPTKQ